MPVAEAATQPPEDSGGDSSDQVGLLHEDHAPAPLWQRREAHRSPVQEAVGVEAGVAHAAALLAELGRRALVAADGQHPVRGDGCQLAGDLQQHQQPSQRGVGLTIQLSSTDGAQTPAAANHHYRRGAVLRGQLQDLLHLGQPVVPVRQDDDGIHGRLRLLGGVGLPPQAEQGGAEGRAEEGEELARLGQLGLRRLGGRARPLLLLHAEAEVLVVVGQPSVLLPHAVQLAPHGLAPVPLGEVLDDVRPLRVAVVRRCEIRVEDADHQRDPLCATLADRSLAGILARVLEAVDEAVLEAQGLARRQLAPLLPHPKEDALAAREREVDVDLVVHCTAVRSNEGTRLRPEEDNLLIVWHQERQRWFCGHFRNEEVARARHHSADLRVPRMAAEEEEVLPRAPREEVGVGGREPRSRRAGLGEDAADLRLQGADEGPDAVAVPEGLAAEAAHPNGGRLQHRRPRDRRRVSV
mmetsp:Transcript_45942/g.142217  ORF Transcript_45942/g.142217 Transcript_45942/m.142217 type:complete len:467 (-) Transcript_45942:166-1566(-)